jgi:hypothetical protein
MGDFVTPDEREQMHILCQRLAEEQDRFKFAEYVSQLNKLLELKATRLRASVVTHPTQPRHHQ